MSNLIKKFFLISLILFFNKSFSVSLRHLINSGKCPQVKNKTLNLSGLNLTCIKGIENIPNIRSVKNISLNDNELVSIIPLLKLKNLVKLDLAGNKINNINCLISLKNLEELYIEHNNIKDLSVLSLMESLRILQVDGNPLEHDNVYDLNYKRRNLRNFNYLEAQTTCGGIDDIVMQEVNQTINTDLCSICQDDDDSKNPCTTKCGHFFHKECLGSWVYNGHNSCPMCRQLL